MSVFRKVALVTGAASGIGAAIAERLAADGLDLMLLDSDADRLRETAERLGARIAVCDVRDGAAVEAAVAEADAEGRLGVLVTSAGVTLGRHFLDLDAESFDRILAINLRGTFLAAGAAARRMAAPGRERPGGAIVTIASVTGMRATSGRSAYAASKGGVIALTQAMAVDLASHGIRANCVAPGAVATPLAAAHHVGAAAAIGDRWRAQAPLARYGEAAEVAEAVAWLASDAAGFVTGQTLAVDGGFMAAGMLFDARGAAA